MTNSTDPGGTHFLMVQADGTCSIELPGRADAPPLTGYPLRCQLAISPDRSTVSIVDMEPITTGEYQARVGPMEVTNTTTVRLKTAGQGRLERSGHVAIPVTLFFDHLFDAPFFEEDSHLTMTLMTRHVRGAPLDASGRVTLAGEGVFVGGVLEGQLCHLTFAACIDPQPW